MLDARPLLPVDYDSIFPHERLQVDDFERFQRASELHALYLFNSVDTFPRGLEYDELLETNRDKVLAPMERAMVRGIIHRSDPGTNKFEGARRTMDTLPGYINPETVSHPPLVEESFYNRSLPNARWIAALKAYQDLSQIDLEFSPELQLEWQLQTSYLTDRLDLNDEFQRRIYDGLRYLWYLERQEGNQGRTIEWNQVGTHAFVVASDILVKRPLPGREDQAEKVYKPAPFANQEEAFNFLRRTVGTESPLVSDGYLQTEYEAALATYEIFSDSGVTVERRVSIKQREASDEFLLALVFGVDNPLIDDVIPQEMKDFFHLAYDRCMASEGGRTPDDIRGYSFEEGMPLNLLKRINGAWPDDCVFVTDLLIEEITIDGKTVSWADQPEFQEHLTLFRRLARGFPVNLNDLIRRHLQILHMEEVAGATPRAEESYYALGDSLTEVYQTEYDSQRRLLGGTWYELDEDLTKILGNEYWDMLAQALLAA